MKKHNKKNNFVNQESNNLEIIPPNPDNNKLIIESPETDSAVNIDREKVQVKKSGNLVVGNINLVLNPFKKRREKYYKENFWHLIVDIFLLLLVVLLVLFLIFINKWQSPKNISLNVINNNKEISAGSLVSFELEYESKIDATESFVKVSLPEKFMIESISPNNLFNNQTNSFNLGDLKSGSIGKIKISGFAWGEKNDHQMISFNFNCLECGKDGFSNSLFYNIEKSALDISVDVGDNIYLNNEFDGKILLKNNTNNLLENVKINLGQDIVLKKSDFEIKNNELIVDKIDINEEKNFVFLAEPKKGESITIKPMININLLNNDFLFFGQEISKNIKTPKFNINISSNKKNVKENEKISYTMSYKNNGTGSIKNIKIHLFSANPNFSIESISANNLKNAEFKDSIITIYDLLENESGSILLDVLFDRRQIAGNQDLYLMADLEYEVENQVIKYKTNSDKNKLLSQVSALASAYYYSPQGDQLGIGPLPPAVGMVTNYWVFLEFNNSGNDLENFLLTAELPKNVYFSDNKRVLDGKLIYGEIGKRLVWEIPVIPSGNNKYRANFELSLIPESDDLGTIPNLLENIKFTVKDSFANQELSGTLNIITADLKNDKLSSGKGKVINLR